MHNEKEIITIKRIGKLHKTYHQHSMPEKFLFCTQCGESLEEIQEIIEFKCGSCHHQVKESDKYCWQCGSKLKISDKIIFRDEISETSELKYNKYKDSRLGKDLIKEN